VNPNWLLIRQILVCASGTLYWVGVFLLAAVIRRRTGQSANLKPQTAKERVLWSGWLIVVVGWIVQPLTVPDIASGPLFAMISPLDQSVGLVAGALLIVGGQVGTYWCYWAMGNSWRVGVNRKKAICLVTRGPYARVRHPIYAFQTMMLLGAACLLPTLMSVLLVALQLVCSYFKALDEERYLTNSLGSSYASYRNRTGWLWPRLTSASVERGVTK